MNSRLGFYLCAAAAVALTAVPMWHIAALAFTTDQYSHIGVIPFVSGYLLYIRRKEFQTQTEKSGSAHIIATLLAASALIIRAIGWKYRDFMSANDFLSLAALSFVLLVVAGFIFLYGTPKAARFPLLLLLLMIPTPDFLLRRIIAALQSGSAEVVSFLYSLLNVPFLRDGLLFHLPKGSIEIAEECSGIRSSIAFLILSLLACELWLRTGWKKVLLTALVLPLVLIKNGIRIVTLSLLGFYVDKSFLTGKLHQMGGVLFFLLAMLLWIPWLELLHRSDMRRTATEPVIRTP